jgi:hypothetical protein
VTELEVDEKNKAERGHQGTETQTHTTNDGVTTTDIGHQRLVQIRTGFALLWLYLCRHISLILFISSKTRNHVIITSSSVVKNIVV